MSIEVQENVILAPHTIYKIGGRARYYVEVAGQMELQAALEFVVQNGLALLAPALNLRSENQVHNVSANFSEGFFVLGAGSNVLVSDKGYEGVVIRLTGGEAKIDGEKLMVDAGVMAAQAVLKSETGGLTGFEWGIGVPGTIGGSIRGNAGCFGYEMKDVVESTDIMQMANGKWQMVTLRNSQCEFGYRDSVFKRHLDWIILSATLRLNKGDPEKIRKKIKQLIAERIEKQDIGTKSCGCIFKNVAWSRKDIVKARLLERFPEFGQFKDQPGIPAAFLIDLAGLKGRRVGKVSISPKHANFFINAGGATAEEVVMLIAIAKDLVRRKFGVLLEEEIQYIGF